jgi:hypothetical protein
MPTRHEAAYQRDLAEYRATPFIVGIQIHPTEYSCSLCRAIGGCYRLKDVPPLPDCCENPWGCTVWWVTVFDNEITGVDWSTTIVKAP